MVYVMEFYVDGGCRGNGYQWATGAAACCLMRKGHRFYSHKSVHLPRYPTPTNQRAEITAIILALQWALERFEELDLSPRLDVRIHSDSKYAIGCMTTWVYKWASNGWQNSSGYDVANRDLIEQASDLDDEVKRLGSVTYEWVPREDNQLADRLCNDELDEQE
ncbi:ribonuclease H-like domain-containing protein [Xylaria telfairii]|nr:ribonuclease H-like domain-containing protein [Xylaria telfairii]